MPYIIKSEFVFNNLVTKTKKTYITYFLKFNFEVVPEFCFDIKTAKKFDYHHQAKEILTKLGNSKKYEIIKIEKQ